MGGGRPGGGGDLQHSLRLVLQRLEQHHEVVALAAKRPLRNGQQQQVAPLDQALQLAAGAAECGLHAHGQGDRGRAGGRPGHSCAPSFFQGLHTWGKGGGGLLSGGGGRGSGTQKFVYHKWPDQIFPTVNFVFSRDGHFGLAGGGLAQGLGIRLCTFGGAYWPLATAHSDPLWVRTCFGCVNGAPG